MTIVEFLEARLAEDEREHVDVRWFGAPAGDGTDDTPALQRAIDFAARGQREAEAKRAILADFGYDGELTAEEHAASLEDPTATAVLRRLASVYADHPEFDQAWQPRA